VSVVPAVPLPHRESGGRLRAWRAAERAAFVASIAAAALLRVVAVFRYRIDSDETQHLHVVWGWSRGLLQYRDVFDNHMPLFHMLLAPLLRLIGERAEALIFMRAAMVPVYAATIVLAYRIAASCYPRRVAAWSTAVASLVPGYLLCSTELRTDDLWTLFWMMCIAILVDAPLTPRRAAAAGLALGAAAGVSAKSGLLLAAVIVGGIVVMAVTKASKRDAIRDAALFLASFALPPAAVAAYFAACGAWQPFVYGTITHNVFTRYRMDRFIALPCLLALVVIVARYVYRGAGDREAGARRLFLFVTANVYAASMFCLWPLVEREHWLPYYPIAAITMVPLVARASARRYAIIAAVEIALVILVGDLSRNRTAPAVALVSQTLRLTSPAEPVMDLKGETVFRRRAFFYVLEPMTKYRLRAGVIQDTIVDDILRTHTMVATASLRGLPQRARSFLARNFIAVGAVRVAGKILQSNRTRFTLQVPAEYAVIGDGAPFTGTIDGCEYDGPRYLAAGRHTISGGRRGEPYALVWARAAAEGFSPFHRAAHSGAKRPSHALFWRWL
jgi:hypothetical protein